MNERLDAVGYAALIRKGELTPEALLAECATQIERHNDALRAVVATYYDEAHAALKTGAFRNTLFQGVPILLKDLGQEVVGWRSTAGARLLAHHRARQTSHFVSALTRAGLLVFGQTNTPEFGFKNISDSRLHGVVRNPYDRERHAGGSSGGAAAALANRMAPIVGASDGGGSIRIPASFTGAIGLKPTRGRVPVGPGSYRGWQGASVSFALTNSVRDTVQLLNAIATEQWVSPFICPKLAWQYHSGAPLRIAVTDESPVGTPVSDTAKQAIATVAQQLEALGHQVSWSAPQVDGAAVMRGYYLMNSVETYAMLRPLTEGREKGLTVTDMEPISWAIYRSGAQIAAADYVAELKQWDVLAEIYAQFHQQYDVLVSPSTADVAPPIGAFVPDAALTEQLLSIDRYSMTQQQELLWEVFADSLAWTPFTQHANLTGQPAISLPLAQSEQGLPLGVQLVAAKGREDVLLGLAHQLETAQLFVRPHHIMDATKF